MRLTADLIGRSPTYVNPLKDREVDLRGNKIPAIENLGATKDSFDSIDLSDNEITRLENLPLLSRLQTLMLMNNRIAKITDFGHATPNLRVLLLTNNRITDLKELDALASLKQLEVLSLMENAVSYNAEYRLYVISLLPSLRILDFVKVKEKEREAARKKYGKKRKAEAAARAAAAAAAASSGTFVPGEAAMDGAAGAHGAGVSEKLTPQQIAVIKQAIVDATSLERVAQLEQALTLGEFPPELQSQLEQRMDED